MLITMQPCYCFCFLILCVYVCVYTMFMLGSCLAVGGAAAAVGMAGGVASCWSMATEQERGGI